MRVMAQVKYLRVRKVLLLLFLLSCSSLVSSETTGDNELQTQSLDLHFRVRRLLVKDLELGSEDDDETNLPPPLPKKKKKLTDSVLSSSPSSTTSGTKKNQTKLIKPISSSSSTKNQTKLTKISSSSSSTKNQTKLAKTSSSSSSTKNQTKLAKTSMGMSTKLISTRSSSNTTTKTGLELKKKLNSGTNSTNLNSSSIKKSVDLSKSSSPPSEKKKPSSKPVTKSKKPIEKEIKPFWLDDEEDEDFVSEFRDLPTRFQRSLIPDLERISTTSKNYINKANKEITKNFKPYFGSKYASTISSIVSFIFILVPLLLLSLIFNRFKSYFSLQKLLIFIQIYLSIYFSILCLSSLITGIEPLKFLYATSSSTYVGLQILQTLGYVFYLLLLLMYLVLVFSTECGLGLRVLGLGQTFVGFAIGLHYYVAVFHRVVLRQPPKTNWKIHGVYATCFLLICMLSSAERRKKEYLEEGGDEGKKN